MHIHTNPESIFSPYLKVGNTKKCYFLWSGYFFFLYASFTFCFCHVSINPTLPESGFAVTLWRSDLMWQQVAKKRVWGRDVERFAGHHPQPAVTMTETWRGRGLYYGDVNTNTAPTVVVTWSKIALPRQPTCASEGIHFEPDGTLTIISGT